MRTIQQVSVSSTSSDLEQKARAYLDTLCTFQHSRSVGSPGNQAAAEFVARTFGLFGYTIDTTPFECLDFESGASSLKCGGKSYDLYPGPYSPGYSGSEKLVAVSTLEELKKARCKGKILLLKGELCVEQLMPKDYPFYYPDHHRALHKLLEKKQPAAIITATGKNPAMVGGMYPYPMIEDGNFDIPSAYCTDVLGEEIAAHAGQVVELTIDARRIPAKACNVIAVKNPEAAKKVVVTAHVDAKATTPGALDNASGVVVLMLLAEMLEGYARKTGIELVAVNGEDNYSAAGEMDYLRRYGAEIGRVRLALNIDGAGYVKGKTAYSFYGCPDELQENVCKLLDRFNGLTEGPEWPQGDHMIFAMSGAPAIAFTSEHLLKLTADITHTSRDVPELVDCRKLVELAEAIMQLITTEE
ncbi:M28 family metallopeptidase [Methanocella sp. MCL-LM]|uniref:M28 family metallopeptidase n=1 Tax=Methanocella sp. MCL-LM TaxID=3412035 RepID=UPI003C741737